MCAMVIVQERSEVLGRLKCSSVIYPRRGRFLAPEVNTILIDNTIDNTVE